MKLLCQDCGESFDAIPTETFPRYCVEDGCGGKLEPDFEPEEPETTKSGSI